MNQDIFIKKFAKSLKFGRAAAFLGAGMSSSAGYVDWKGLLKDVALELELDITKEDDLISLAQYYVSYKQNKKPLVESIIENINKSKAPTELHKILASLPLDTYWTTNYDDLIEKAVKSNGKRIDVKRCDKDLLYPVKGSDVIIYKMHGDITVSSDAVISKDDYELYQGTHGSMLNVLKGDLTTKSFLFIGYGFNDPDLIDLLARIRCMVGEEKQEHYAIIRKLKENEYANNAEYEYAKKKRKLQNNDFKRYGIEIIEIDEYVDISSLLRKIAVQVNKENVFFSSAIADSQKENLDLPLLRGLVKSVLELSEESKIISGYGLNIGPIIIEETMEYLKIHSNKKFEEKLKLYPFPLESPREWTMYRNIMLSDVGVCILLYGTKEKAGQVVNSNGMKEEFEIAKNNGALIVPVGCTGGMSAEIADKLIRENYHVDELKYLKEATDSQKLIEKVASILCNNKDTVEEEK